MRKVSCECVLEMLEQCWCGGVGCAERAETRCHTKGAFLFLNYVVGVLGPALK